MRVLIVVSCLMAVASAGWAGLGGYGGYHVPVIGPNGVPLDEPAVAAARAEHYAAHAEAAARAGAGHGLLGGGGAGLAAAHYAPAASRWYGPIHIPVITSLGVPLDEPAVQAARAEHAAAYAGASHGVSPYAGHGGYAIAGPAVPHDTPEVAAAKAAHFAAHAEVASRGVYNHYRRRRSVYGGYQGPLPVIGHDGVPQDEPAVAAAKAHHFAAFNEAAARNAGQGYQSAGPQALAGPSHYEPAPAPWRGPIHIPVIGPNGVPVEPHEVQAARASHIAALNDAASHSAGHAYPRQW